MLRPLVVFVLGICTCAPAPGPPTHLPPGNGWQCVTNTDDPFFDRCFRECDTTVYTCAPSTGAWCFDNEANPDPVWGFECYPTQAECDASRMRASDPTELSLCAFEP